MRAQAVRSARYTLFALVAGTLLAADAWAHDLFREAPSPPAWQPAPAKGVGFTHVAPVCLAVGLSLAMAAVVRNRIRLLLPALTCVVVAAVAGCPGEPEYIDQKGTTEGKPPPMHRHF